MLCRHSPRVPLLGRDAIVFFTSCGAGTGYGGHTGGAYDTVPEVRPNPILT